MVTPNRLMDIGYTYTIFRLKNTPEIIFIIINLVWLSTWTTSRISWTLDLQGRDQYLKSIYHDTVLTGTEKKELPTTFDMYIRYKLWDSGYKNSINPYFGLYI